MSFVQLNLFPRGGSTRWAVIIPAWARMGLCGGGPGSLFAD